ncbi:unnamed protein product, partial [Mesorhabditis belari]|uniref:Major facilitator superfamily (MFS) profile domain-containing protein n=1 Tax=Mesorhabditis belari TaxID=2138241 RepID=A0AAF3JC85_9BILA
MAKDVELLKGEQRGDKGLLHPHSRRLHVLLMLMSGTACMALLTTNVGITITCMVNSTAVALEAAHSAYDNESVLLMEVTREHEQCHADTTALVVDYGIINRILVVDYGGELLWSEQWQSYVKGAAFLGGLLAVLPGGIASDRRSVTRILLVSMALMSLCNVLFPIASKFNKRVPILAILLRFGMGLGEAFFLPAQNALMVRWIPLNEKASAGAIYSIGYQVAGILGVPLSAALCQSSLGWPAVYYISALFGFLWIGAFNYLASDSPSIARWMSEAEREYLSRELQHLKQKKQKIPFPTRHVLRSAAIWVLLYASFSGNFVITFIQLYIPSFFKDVLLMNVKKNGLTTAIPHLSQVVAKFTWSTMIDRAKRNGLSPTHAVRISQAVSCIGLVIGFFSIATFADCTNPWLAIGLLCLVTSSFGISIAGFVCSLLSMAPAHVGTLTSLTHAIGFVGRWACPLIVQHFKTIGTTSEWKQIFYTFSVIPLISLLTFTFFGSGEIQTWGRVPTMEIELNESSLLGKGEGKDGKDGKGEKDEMDESKKERIKLTN